jgi:hypothetical protein
MSSRFAPEVDVKASSPPNDNGVKNKVRFFSPWPQGAGKGR